MALDLSNPRGDRTLIPGANLRDTAGPVFPDIVYYKEGDPNVFEMVGSVAALIRKSGHAAHAAKYRRIAFEAGSYDEVIEITMEWVHVLEVLP